MTKLLLCSSGKDQAMSLGADLYIDCRGIRNPFRDPVLGGLTGDDPKVQDWIQDQNVGYVDAAILMINTALDSAPTRNSFKRAPDKPLKVCFFCLAGVHRSRGMKNVIGRLYKMNGREVEVV